MSTPTVAPALNVFLFFARATLLGMVPAWILMVNRMPGAVLIVAALTLIMLWFWLLLQSIPHARWILFADH
jgi:hypothetical protein